MNIVDSSGWLEYFADGPNARAFSDPLQNTSELIVPTIIIYEVFKVTLREKDEDSALMTVALMRQGKIVEFDQELAMGAAKISLEHKIPMADSIILATAQRYDALVWTQDEDFEGISGVRYFPKRPTKTGT